MIMVLIGTFSIMVTTYFGWRLLWDILTLLYHIRSDKEDKEKDNDKSGYL